VTQLERESGLFSVNAALLLLLLLEVNSCSSPSLQCRIVLVLVKVMLLALRLVLSGLVAKVSLAQPSRYLQRINAQYAPRCVELLAYDHHL
jgi:hypothetical protein